MKRHLMLTLLAVLLRPADAAAQAWWDKYRNPRPDVKLFEYLQQLSFSGDLRLRNEGFNRNGPGLTDRNRSRLRLRLGAKALLPWGLTINTRLASGTGEQVSTNQSYDNLGSQKQIWIDQAYARWAPVVSQEGDGSVYLQGGRMVNSLWRLYTSDLLWDDDFNPEGYAEGAEWLLPAGLSVFANAMQAVADEDSSSARNQWVFSQQAGLEARLPFDSRLRAAAAYHVWTDTQRNTLSQNAVQDGNRRLANGTLANRFRVAELTGQLSAWAGRVPIALQGTLIRNVGAVGLDGTTACPASATCAPARDGYQAGLIVGAAKEPGTWEAAYMRKYAQTDSTIADVADSDFGDGGLNQEGHIAWLAYAPAQWLAVRGKYFVVNTIDTQHAPGNKTVRRYQLDMQLKF